jgi:hypothetical protein
VLPGAALVLETLGTAALGDRWRSTRSKGFQVTTPSSKYHHGELHQLSV